MSRLLLRAAAVLRAARAAAPPAGAGDAEALARFRKALDGEAAAEERAGAAGGLAGLDSRAAAELACRGLARSLELLDGFSARRTEVRGEMVRIRAADEAKDGPTRESAAALTRLRDEEEILRGRDEEERGVLEALRGLLGRFRERAAVEFLASVPARSASPPALRREVLEALGSIGGDVAAKAVRGALRDRDPAVRVAALASRAGLRKGEEGILRDLEAGLRDERWTVRLGAIRAVAAVGSPEAVDLLLPALARETGKPRADVAALLRGLTGQRFGSEPEGWTHWWRENREAFVTGERILTPGAPGPDRAGDGPSGEADYYGITVESLRILFVIDVSGSMESAGNAEGGTPKIDEAVKELLRCVGNLDPASFFTVYAFDDAVRKWKPGLVPADAAAREGVSAWARALQAASWTNTYAALEEALKASAADPRNNMGADYDRAADTIFLLTDGAPTTPGGRPRDAKGNPEYLRVLEGVRQWNREKRVAIHAVGIGEEINSEFLSTLARENGGTFVRAR